MSILTPTQESLCGLLDQNFTPLTNPVELAKKAFKTTLRSFQSELSAASFSPQSIINSALNDLISDVRAILPGDTLNDMTELKNFMDSCEYLSDNPASNIIGTFNGIYDRVDDFIGGIGVTVPEFNIGAIGDAMNDIVQGIDFPGGNKISETLQKADKLINCMSSLCPGFDVTSKVSTLQGLFDSYKLIDNPLDINYGKIDFQTIYTDIGMSAAEITGMNTSVGGILGVKTGALDSINKSVEKVKSLTKIGGFF